MSNALLVDKREAAARLSIGMRSLERLLENGELRPVKVGRSTRIVVDELQAFVLRLQEDREA